MNSSHLVITYQRSLDDMRKVEGLIGPVNFILVNTIPINLLSLVIQCTRGRKLQVMIDFVNRVMRGLHYWIVIDLRLQSGALDMIVSPITMTTGGKVSMLLV